MPELPEVESVVRDLREELPGEIVATITTPWKKWLVTPSLPTLRKRLVGQAITNVTRRGKYILFAFADDSTLLSHLRMTGRWLVNPDSVAESEHCSAKFGFQSGKRVLFQDVRKFGRASWYPAGSLIPALEATGIEPLDPALTPDALYELFRTRKRDLKSLLLDQSVVAGLGNIYISEILYRAGINPFQRADQLTRADAKRFHEEMRIILEFAIDQRGTSIYDYRGAKNQPGNFQEYLRVYQRQGEACAKCGATILRALQGQRSTFFCPRCQRVPQVTAQTIEKGYSQRRRGRPTAAKAAKGKREQD